MPVPEDAWEYQIRKSLNDAAYNGLQYVPYCSTMPVQEKCDEPKFMWVSLCLVTAQTKGNATLLLLKEKICIREIPQYVLGLIGHLAVY